MLRARVPVIFRAFRRVGQTASMAKIYRLGPVRRVVNVMMTAMIRVGVGATSSYLLTSTGRKSGQPRLTPVIPVEACGQRWLVSPYGWNGLMLATGSNGGYPKSQDLPRRQEPSTGRVALGRNRAGVRSYTSVPYTPLR